jgi:hypothetical protein
LNDTIGQDDSAHCLSAPSFKLPAPVKSTEEELQLVIVSDADQGHWKKCKLEVQEKVDSLYLPMKKHHQESTAVTPKFKSKQLSKRLEDII